MSASKTTDGDPKSSPYGQAFCHLTRVSCPSPVSGEGSPLGGDLDQPPRGDVYLESGVIQIQRAAPTDDRLQRLEGAPVVYFTKVPPAPSGSQ